MRKWSMPGFSMVLACGGGGDFTMTSSDRGDGAPAAPAVAPEPEVPEDTPAEEMRDPPGMKRARSTEDPLGSIVARGALDVLERHCGECHANGADAGGVGELLELDALIASGLIVPGSSSTSPLLVSILDGRMPPGEAQNRLVSGEISVIARFIDELEAAPAPACDALPFIDSDEAYARMAADIAQQAPADRPFLRYLGLTYASNAGLCGAALERQRWALFKQVNSVSTAPEIRPPAPIDSRELLYRIDMRDYGFHREIDLLDDGSTVFKDGWLAMVAAAGPYAMELEGVDADLLKSATGTVVPYLPANAFVRVSASGDLYYALIGARANVAETQFELGIDLEELLLGGALQRAAFTDRDPYRVATVYRAAVGSLPDRHYWFLSSEMGIRGSNVFDDPVGYPRDGGHVIYHLPNGLQAFLVADNDWRRVSDASGSCMIRECDPLHRSSAAGECQGCHAGGLLPVVDVLREVVEANSGEFDSETLEAVQRVYPTQDELAELQRQDNEVYLTALAQAGVPRGAPDPVSRVFWAFAHEEIDLRRVAAELGVRPEALANSLAQLGQSFEPLAAAGGTLERAALSSAFHAAQCILHAEAANRPANCP